MADDKLKPITPARVATDETFVRRDVPSPVDDGWFTVESEMATVTLDLPADARWVIERYPAQSVDEHPDGGVRVVLPVLPRPLREMPQARAAERRLR